MSVVWQELFGQAGEFKVSHMGEPPWEVVQKFNDPASEEFIAAAEDEMGLPVPEGVKSFWRFSNGAILYRSVKPPVWGWRVIACSKYLETQHKWRRKFFDEWRTGYLAVAELLNPLSVVVWDCYNKKMSFLDTSSGDMKPIEISETFEEFMQKMAQSQGGLYWQW